MSRTASWISRTMVVGITLALGLRAVHVHSVADEPHIYRVAVSNNDLESVEGLAPPGRLVELWYKQRTFKEGSLSGNDHFSLCGWKNGGVPVLLGSTHANPNGVWSLHGLREQTAVMLFPGAPGGNACHGGVLTQLLPRACDAPGVGCTDWAPPDLRWLNVKKVGGNVGTASGSIEDAHTAAVSVADGPNDGPAPSSVFDVDQNGIDTALTGFELGQRVTWKCGSGGTALCPSVAIHDASTLFEPDPEFPFVLGTLQGHRPGGSIFAAAAINRGQPLGLAVNVDVRLRGDIDHNLGCDEPAFFDFLVPLLQGAAPL